MNFNLDEMRAIAGLQESDHRSEEVAIFSEVRASLDKLMKMSANRMRDRSVSGETQAQYEWLYNRSKDLLATMDRHDSGYYN
jgi:hypothetical protein